PIEAELDGLLGGDRLAVVLLLFDLFAERVEALLVLGRGDAARACLDDRILDGAAAEHVPDPEDEETQDQKAENPYGEGGFGEGADLSKHRGAASLFPWRTGARFRRRRYSRAF